MAHVRVTPNLAARRLMRGGSAATSGQVNSTQVSPVGGRPPESSMVAAPCFLRCSPRSRFSPAQSNRRSQVKAKDGARRQCGTQGMHQTFDRCCCFASAQAWDQSRGGERSLRSAPEQQSSVVEEGQQAGEAGSRQQATARTAGRQDMGVEGQ